MLSKKNLEILIDINGNTKEITPLQVFSKNVVDINYANAPVLMLNGSL